MQLATHSFSRSFLDILDNQVQAEQNFGIKTVSRQNEIV